MTVYLDLDASLVFILIFLLDLCLLIADSSGAVPFGTVPISLDSRWYLIVCKEQCS